MIPRKTSRKTRTKRCFLSWFVQKIYLFQNHFTKHNKKKSYNIRIMSVFKTPATASRWPECPFVFFMLLYTYIKYSWISLHPNLHTQIYIILFEIYIFSYRQSFPRVLLSSALCRCGYWSASFLRAACAQTMNAFMGLLTWGLLFRDPFPLTGIGTKDQSYPFRTWETASRIHAGNLSSSSESSFLPKPASRDPWPSEPVGEDGASESDSSWDMELFVPDGLHGWSPTHLSCSSVIFNIICSVLWKWKFRCCHWSSSLHQIGQCAFARVAPK